MSVVLIAEPGLSISVTDRVLGDCCNVCNANMRQLELMPVINICCHTNSLHNTATASELLRDTDETKKLVFD